jgi:hypothetical protein
MGLCGQRRISADFEPSSDPLFDLRSDSSTLWINLLFTESHLLNGFSKAPERVDSTSPDISLRRGGKRLRGGFFECVLF